MIVVTTGAARRRVRELRPTDSGVGLDERLAAAFEGLALPVDTSRLATVVPAGTLVLLAGAHWLFGTAGAVLLAALVVGGGTSLRRSAPRRRAAAFERALPAVLDGVARQLRSGGSLGQAIDAARPPASVSPDLAASWDRLRRAVPLVGVVAALDDWASTPPATVAARRAVGLSAAALGLAASTGGSPARAIDGVAATLRSRLAVADEVRALSSQARASAMVIALAPLAFGALAGATDARTRTFLSSGPGLVLVGLGLALDALGAWWMTRLCRSPDA